MSIYQGQVYPWFPLYRANFAFNLAGIYLFGMHQFTENIETPQLNI